MFDSNVRAVYTSEGADSTTLTNLYSSISAEIPSGGTDMYSAAAEGIAYAMQSYNISDYCPAVILMTDGVSVTGSRDTFITEYDSCKYDIPVFSIMFGDADDSQLTELAELTNARVFDGRDDLIGVFRS